MRKFSVVIANRHTTSISLEEEFYQALRELAAEQGLTINALITEIDNTRQTANLSSALRLYVLRQLQQKLENAASKS